MSRADERPLLAVEFLDAVEAGTARALQRPDSGRRYPGRKGRSQALCTAQVRSFPYSIACLVDGDGDGDDPVILAYPHDRQRPGFWRHRLDA